MSLQILTEVVDWNGDKARFLAPSVDDAVAGLHDIMSAAFVHEIGGSLERKTTNPETVSCIMYKVEVNEELQTIEKQQVEIFNCTFEFWPIRFKGLQIAALNPENKEEEKSPLVTLN